MIFAKFATLALAAQSPTAQLVIPVTVPERAVITVEQSDVRWLPDGGTATFRQRGELRFTRADDAVLAAYRVLDRQCDGPAAICAAFQTLGAGMDGRLFRFRIHMPDRSVTLVDAVTVPLAAAGGESANAVVAVVAQSEAIAPGAILAAEIGQLIRFAGMPLPPIGSEVRDAVGSIRLVDRTDSHAVVGIQRAPHMADGVSLSGGGECRIGLATGLAEHCRFRDWAGTDMTRPLRERETRLTITAVAVF